LKNGHRVVIGLVPGHRVGRWTLISIGQPHIKKGGRERRRWLCRCSCGTEKLVLEQSLRLALWAAEGGSRSCGCLALERSTKHAHNRAGRPTSEYSTWVAAKKRCFNPRNPSYKDYGQRGIRMCAAWANSFSLFLRDMGLKPDPTYSLDRVDPDGDYAPGNCRWAPLAVQARNKRNVRWYAFRGERLILAEVADRLGITRDQARSLERRGSLPAEPIGSGAFAAIINLSIDLNNADPADWHRAQAFWAQNEWLASSSIERSP
jgi:hypothetical protein